MIHESPGLATDLTASEVARLRTNPSVALVEPDYVRHTPRSAASVQDTNGHGGHDLGPRWMRSSVVAGVSDHVRGP